MNKLYLKLLLESKKQNSVIYYIDINGGSSGFFAILRVVLDYLGYADNKEWLPYIKYKKNVLYAEKQLLFGTNNPFEYYFEQPCFKGKTQYGLFPNIINSNRNDFILEEKKYNSNGFSYKVDDAYIIRMSYIYGKYISLNKRTDRIITSRVKNILAGKRTLGVHIRGTDFYKKFDNHPVPIEIEEYAEKIKKIVEQNCYEQVFIATDDKRSLSKIRQLVSVPVVYYKNSKRSDSNRSVAFCKDQRKYNNYYLGLEVLLDTYTLVACDGFIGCLSQVDIFVRIIKESKNEKFDYVEIIDNGIVRNERQCWEPKER